MEGHIDNRKENQKAGQNPTKKVTQKENQKAAGSTWAIVAAGSKKTAENGK